ncbi:hypothetical protein QYF36_024898 [Acer negundo]|nr:hypothetical protein QYF36_024898 [Acer negundo]
MMNKAADQAAEAPDSDTCFGSSSDTYFVSSNPSIKAERSFWVSVWACVGCCLLGFLAVVSVACLSFFRSWPHSAFYITVYCILTRRARKKNITTEDEIDGKDILTAETLQFDLGTIQAATNRFSTDNKLGAGGFGVVYKGVLPNGKDIAVKRLSKRSGQGAEEFKNECWEPLELCLGTLER